MKRILIYCSLSLLLLSLSAQSNSDSKESAGETVEQTIKQAEESLNRLLNKFGKKKKNPKAKQDDQASSSADETGAAESSTQLGQHEEPKDPVNPSDAPNTPVPPSGGKGPVLTDVPPFPNQDFGQEPYSEKGIVGKGPFGTKAAYWIKESHVTHESTNMKVQQYDTLTFDDFGRFQHLRSFHSQEISMFGLKQNQKSRTHSWTLGDSIFSYKPPERKGFSMANPGAEFYEGITEEQAEKFSKDMADASNTSLKRRGTDEVAGKLCEVWESETRNEDGIVIIRTRMWYWRGIVLQTHTIGMGIEEKTTTTTILPKDKISARTFNLPGSIRFHPMNVFNH